MEEKAIFNFFDKMFDRECQRNIVENMRHKITENDDFELLYLFPTQLVGKEETLEIYKKSLFECCANYISLANIDINLYPSEALDFVELILESNEKDSYYGESFLFSLQLIYQKFFSALNIDSPVLNSCSEDSDSSYLEVILNSSYHLLDFRSVNMSELEQTKTMTKILKLELENKLGPLQNVKYCYRKDI